MGVIRGLENAGGVENGRVVAIGVFDGVHWGHRAIFEEVVKVSRELGAVAAALTFDKHPTEYLAPSRAPQYISTLDQRVELIKSLGVSEVLVAEFGHELSTMPKEEFVEDMLVGSLQARHVVVGANFRFARAREGDINYLGKCLPRLHAGLSVVPAVVIAGGPVSSTRIRLLIGRGDVDDAAKLLGRWFALRGRVVAGQRIGRTIGFPTANLETSPRQLIPARGVYVVEATIGNTAYTGVCNIGSRPTFNGTEETVEVHFAGFSGDIYGNTLDVVFRKRLRDEMTFASREKLAEQIRKDVDAAKNAGLSTMQMK